MDWPAHGGHVRPRWGGSAGFLGRRASRGITSLLASTAAAEGRGGEGRGGGGREEGSEMPWDGRGGKGREINVRRLVYRQQSHAKSRGAHPRRALFIHEPMSLPPRMPLPRVSPYRFYLF